MNIVVKKLKAKQINNRRGKRLSQKNVLKSVVFAGVNPVGIRLKWPTWKKVIMEAGANVWTMQETKCVQNNQLKMDDFVIYDKVRVEKEGGSIAIAAKKDLNPVLFAEGEEDVEAITIDIHPSKIIVSCTSAYGPQQRDTASKKAKCWSYLDHIADSA